MLNKAPYPWQQQQWHALTETSNKQQLPHALLLKGIAGLGKTEFAVNLAKFILCENPKDSQACSHCKACNLFEKQTHPDFHMIQPEEEGKAVKMDQIKALINSMNTSSQYDGYKICLIQPAEAMNTSSANALLKTLEEPVSTKTLFLLVTDQFMLLPATIRSRCQQISFNPPSKNCITNWLNTASIDASKEELDLALTLAQNAPLKVLCYLTTDNTSQDLYLDLTDALQNNSSNISEFLKKYKQLSNKDFIETLQLVVSQAIKNNSDSADSYVQHFAILDSLSYHKAIVAKNVVLNSQLLMENYLIKLANLN